MSFSSDKRERIKSYLMENIFKNEKDMISKTQETFQVSSTTIYKYLKELQSEKKIMKQNNGKYKLILKVSKVYDYKDNIKELEEYEIFKETLHAVIWTLPENVQKIWVYAFTEMFNNVIDHSDSQNVRVYIAQNALYTWVNIIDDGIGIFNKIAQYYNYNNIDDAVLNLFKGKLTTDKENHTGEGIFFTSRVMDHFAAISNNKYFSHDNTIEELKDLENSMEYGRYKNRKGTTIIMALSNNSTKKVEEVFDMFSSVDGGFTTTQVPMKHVCDNGYPVSRSQAKRLYAGFDKFKKVILDFTDIDDIGQGFAHELFCVFKQKHRDIELECINDNEKIKKMINHVTK